MTFYAFICITTILESGRSPWRTEDPLEPEIRVHWSDDTKIHTLRDHCLEYHAIFCKFNKEQFESHLLPKDPIPYRNKPDQTVDPQELARLIQRLIEEIQTHKKSFTDFTVLKKSDFNPRIASGLIILKFKSYPFVLKLFLKTPESFVTLSEGLIPKFFFRMGGGTNRHLSGFTRVPNLEKIRERIQESPHWSALVDTPRKWYWIPKDTRWITIEGKNIGTQPTCTTTIPAIYGIVVDAIEAERHFNLSNAEDIRFGLAFAQYIGNRMDAHVDNFILEKGTGKIVIIDTEHFPTMVGLKKQMNFTSYHSWYLQLSGKCIQDNFMRSKKYRREMQTNPTPEIYSLYEREEVPKNDLTLDL
jgi:hypothetical protein